MRKLIALFILLSFITSNNKISATQGDMTWSDEINNEASFQFIIDELAVSGNTPNELIADLVEALEKATLQMEEMNGVKE